METNEFLDGYAGQSTDELIALASDYRVDSIVVSFQEALDQKDARVGTASLTEEERIILAVEAMESEVNNGGYNLFFLNSSCEYATLIVRALERIGCPTTARITRAAIEVLKIDGEPTVSAIESVLAEENKDRQDALSELDSAYYESGEDIAGRLFEFIKSNRDRIALKP